MLKRYDDHLTTRLEAVADHGHAYVTWSEIYRWYNVKRIDRNIWADIKERFQTVIEDPNAQLWIYEDGHGVMFIADDGLISIDDKFAPKAAAGKG
jgi:hypothetical protein